MKRILIAILSVGAVFSAAAQNQGSISQQIEVTREYRPDMGAAAKLNIEPQMSDSVSLKPDVDYSITPTPWKTVFDTGPIEPIGISAAEYIPAWPYYVRIGGGLPGMTLLDVYATAQNSKGTYGGVYANHYGEWVKLKNDLDDKLSANRMRNIAGGFFGTRLSGRDLCIDAGWDNRRLDAFGYYDPLDAVDGDPERIKYNDISAKVAYGDPFKDFSKFNWRIGASVNYFTGNEAGVLAVGADAAIGAGIGAGRLMVDARMDYGKGRKSLGDFSNTIIGVTPRYEFVTKNFDLSLGVMLVGDIYSDSTAFIILPAVRVAYSIENLFTVYGKADGDVSGGNFKELSYMNPYMLNPQWVDNGSRVGARLGFFGSVGTFLSFDVFGGMDTYTNYLYFVNDGAGFSAQYTDIVTGAAVRIDPNIYYAGIVLNARIVTGFTLDLSARFNSVGKSGKIEGSQVTGIPTYEVGTMLRYEYDNRLFLSLGADFMGKRDVGQLIPGNFGLEGATIPAAVNLKAGAEYRIQRNASVFVSADNLLGQKIYRFNHYPQLGANVMAGLKIRF